MRRSLVWCAVLALLIPACKGEKGGDASAPPQVGAPYNGCKVDSDCAWGEIEHEILERKDCVCLYGCPYIPLSKQTVERRAGQHARLCEARQDGHGDPCGIDDCAEPPPLVCDAGVCGAAPPDAS